MSGKVFAAVMTAAVALAFAGAMPASAVATRYVYTDLGVLGGLDSQAWSINNLGQVIGHADTDAGSAGRGFHAFLWTPLTRNGTSGAIVDLGTLAGDLNSSAYGINDSGTVVGVSMTVDLTQRAFLFNRSMSDLGSLKGGETVANAINNPGQVVGSSNVATAHHPFLWVPSKPGEAKGRFYDLGLPAGSPGAAAVAINSAGTVTGSYYDGDFFAHAFVWVPATANGTSGTMAPLVEPPGTVNSFTQAINDKGLMVGTMNNGITDRAFVYDTAMHDLGTLRGGTSSFAYGVNGSGQIVGYGDTAVRANDHAFIYQDGAMTDLNKLLPGSVKSSGVVLTVAYGINDAGQIVGVATIAGHKHGFLLTPA